MSHVLASFALTFAFFLAILLFCFFQNKITRLNEWKNRSLLLRTNPRLENDSLDWERFLGLRTIPGIQYDSRDWVRFQGLRTFPPLNVSSLLPPWPGFWNFINWIWISWIQNFFLRHTSQSFFFYPITRLTWFSLYLSILSQSKFDCPILLLPNTENCQGGLPMGKRCQTRPLHYEHCFFETHHIISRNFKHIMLVNPRQQSLKSSGTVPLTQRNPVSRSNRIRTAAIKDSHFICILRKSTMPLNSWAEQREGLQGSPGGNRIRRNLVDIYLFDLLVYDLLLILLSIVIVAILIQQVLLLQVSVLVDTQSNFDSSVQTSTIKGV